MNTLLIWLMTIIPTDSLIMQLDQVVANRQVYINKRLEKIDSLKALPRTQQVAEQIYTAYDGFDTDSAMHYAQQCAPQRGQIHYAKCLATNGMFEAAKHILLPMESHLLPQNRNLFYKNLCLCYVWERDFSTVDSTRQKLRAIIPAIRDSIIATTTDPIWKVQEQASLIRSQYPEQAVALLSAIIDTLPQYDNMLRYLCHSMAACYAKMGNEDKATYYFAQSALCDELTGAMEHSSLRELARIMIKRGDIQHAYLYMTCCLEDAEFCNARLRIIEIADDMPMILESYNQYVQSRHRQSVVFICVLSVLLIILIGLLVWLNSTKRTLRQALTQLEQTNEQLTIANRIRSAYVTQYMDACSQIIERMDSYHKNLRKLSVKNDTSELFNILKSDEFIKDNLTDFYQHFDETFLVLFPNFIEELNALLVEEGRFSIDPKRGKQLSTPLRIYALIRLGITNSEDIARFLRISVQTVFNYRTSIRNYAIGDRHELEQQISLEHY